MIYPYCANTILIMDINIASITPRFTPKDFLVLGICCLDNKKKYTLKYPKKGYKS